MPASISSKDGRQIPINVLLPYTYLCTIGPSITAANSLYIVRYLMCRYYWIRTDPTSNPSPGDGICENKNVEAIAGSVMAGLAFLDGIVSFLSTSYVQRLADRFGRRPLLVALPLLATISTGSMMIAYGTKNPTFAWILLVLNGTFVSASTKSIFVPTLCVADVASDDERTTFYSRLEAVSLLGPGSAYIASALISRSSPNPLIPYYLALTSQLLASTYALLFIPETLSHHPSTSSSSSIHSTVDSDDNGQTYGEEVMESVVAPIRPLRLLLPHRDEKGRWRWRLSLLTVSLLSTTCGTVFVATGSLLFMTDKFNFAPENNAWVLAYLTFSRFIYLIIFFPVILKYGRKAYHKYEHRNAGSRDQVDETSRLVVPDGDSGGRKEGKGSGGGEANHFDVILAFVSVVLDTVSLSLISLSKNYKQVLGCFALNALASGDAPTFKSVFVSSVKPSEAGQALAALDMVLSAAKLASPPILGGIYAGVVGRGKPELMFLAAGGFCAVGALFLGPIVLGGRK